MAARRRWHVRPARDRRERLRTDGEEVATTWRVIVADTDMPVPRIVSRIRIDFYTPTEHVWYGSRDLSRAQPSDWPVSFGVHLPDASSEREVLVRLRAYPQGEHGNAAVRSTSYDAEMLIDLPEMNRRHISSGPHSASFTHGRDDFRSPNPTEGSLVGGASLLEELPHARIMNEATPRTHARRVFRVRPGRSDGLIRTCGKARRSWRWRDHGRRQA